MNYEYQEKLENIMMPTVDEILDYRFNYPDFVKTHIDETEVELIDRLMYNSSNMPIILENVYLKQISKLQLQYAYDYFVNGTITEDIYTDQMRIITLKYLSDLEDYKKMDIEIDLPKEDDISENEVIKSEESSRQRALDYYNGKVPLSSLSIKDLDQPIDCGKKSKKLSMIKRILLSRLDNITDIENKKIGDLMKGKHSEHLHSHTILY